jgi:hypothetical protein
MKIGYAHLVGLAMVGLVISCVSTEAVVGKNQPCTTNEDCNSQLCDEGVCSAIHLPNVDNPYCDSTNAKANVACTVDCSIPCGFGGLGTKYCTCANGAYWQCPCIPPDDWQGATTAPCCDTSDGQTTELANLPCTEEWAQCVGTDPNTGTPRGCACVRSAGNGALSWKCGSTNHWFMPEEGAQCG